MAGRALTLSPLLVLLKYVALVRLLAKHRVGCRWRGRAPKLKECLRSNLLSSYVELPPPMSRPCGIWDPLHAYLFLHATLKAASDETTHAEHGETAERDGDAAKTSHSQALCPVYSRPPHTSGRGAYQVQMIAVYM
ncbi:hypothetical protein NDU88_002183 [Pleurodeles waltl]|uniref:Secreted protein n=1 Tax=Pleurodeles waltl TaxID=8319 RepID=A0AAV7SBR4_PLEWA|nr:hypothetical protein NDU88_002183 [Pleurodeles waltl]